VKEIAMRNLLIAVLLAASGKQHDWLGSEMPLPLAVRTAQDLAFKSVAERQYLIFNLLASGKVAWDQGDFAAAASRWESLLGVPGLDPEIDKLVRPLAQDARKRAGGKAGDVPPPPPSREPSQRDDQQPAPRRREPASSASVSVEGTVSGGGAAGPGGAVVTLRRTDGPMPRLSPAKKVVLQRGKAFVPRVLAVAAGSSIVFRNEDAINHNVFSLAPHFDTGLYGAGGEKEETFDKAGVVQLLCNIHSSMIGYLVVVDTPHFAQADAAGAFSIKGVAPGEYAVEVWHENASQPTRQKLTVPKDGAKLALTVAGDKQPPAYPPDKYGKPRQQQLGY
jgi:plastocyanin